MVDDMAGFFYVAHYDISIPEPPSPQGGIRTHMCPVILSTAYQAEGVPVVNNPTRIRTEIPALRGRHPEPLDDRVKVREWWVGFTSNLLENIERYCFSIFQGRPPWIRHHRCPAHTSGNGRIRTSDNPGLQPSALPN